MSRKRFTIDDFDARMNEIRERRKAILPEGRTALLRESILRRTKLPRV